MHIHIGCGESLKGVDPSMIHRKGSTLIHKDCGEPFAGEDPPMIQCTKSRPIHMVNQ